MSNHWETIADRLIREGIEQGKFDDLPGKGQPLDLEIGLYEDRLAPTIRRILRDNGCSHPLLEARKAIEAELEAARNDFRRTRDTAAFETRVHQINREIRLFALRSPAETLNLKLVELAEELKRF